MLVGWVLANVLVSSVCHTFDSLNKNNGGTAYTLSELVAVRVDGLSVGPCGTFDFLIKKIWRDSLYSE